MYERLLKETERYLECQREIVVPVKRIWDAMVKQSRTESFSVPSHMADFECLLEADRRFEFVTPKGHPMPEEEEEDPVEREEMKKLGFSDDQSVKLRRMPLASPDDDEPADLADTGVPNEESDGDLGEASLLDAEASRSVRSASRSKRAKVSVKDALHKTKGKQRKHAAKKTIRKKRKK